MHLLTTPDLIHICFVPHVFRHSSEEKAAQLQHGVSKWSRTQRWYPPLASAIPLQCCDLPAGFKKFGNKEIASLHEQ